MGLPLSLYLIKNVTQIYIFFKWMVFYLYTTNVFFIMCDFICIFSFYNFRP